MMEPMKASTIRAELRKALQMTDAELSAWFKRRFAARQQNTEANRVETELRQLCDALAKEAKRPAAPRKKARVSSRVKR